MLSDLLIPRSRWGLGQPASPRRRAASRQRGGRFRVVPWGVTPAFMALSWGWLIRRAGTGMAGLWRGVVPTAGSISHIHQRRGAGVALVRSDGISRKLLVWTLIQTGVADAECRHDWFTLPHFRLSRHLPWVFTFPHRRHLSRSLYSCSLGPMWVFWLIGKQRVECPNWGWLVLTPTGAVPAGAARGWCWRAKEHFPVRARRQWLVGEMRGWTVAGIMEEVTIFPSAESVWGGEGVAVWVAAFRGRIRVARP